MSNLNSFSAKPAHVFTPFWRRLPHFFHYPLQLGSMLRIIGYSVGSGLSMFLPSLFIALLNLIIWIVFLKYATLVMEHTANGRFDEPNALDGSSGSTAQVARQIGLVMIYGVLFGLLSFMLGKVGFGLGLILVQLAIPAGIMIIAVSASLREAVNPSRILFFIRTIGSPYLALCFLLLSMTSSGQWLQGFLKVHIDSWLVLPLITFVQFYFTLITYHMMGYVIYQYHEQLGLNAAVSYEKAEAKLSPGKVTDPIFAKLSALIADGEHEQATELLRDALRTKWENNDLHERYQKLLLATGKEELATQHARDFIVKLVNEKRMFQALDLCESCLKRDSGFQLRDSTQIHKLAAAAWLGKRPKLALDLMRSFDKRYPNHPDIPAIYLLSAKVLSEEYNKYKESIQILHAIQAKFPTHAIATEASQYISVVQKLASIK